MTALITQGPVGVTAVSPALVKCQQTMALAGWEIDFVDIDLTGQNPTVEVKVVRNDGRWLWARVDSIGRCTTETFQRERHLGMAPNQRGRRPLVPLVDDVFLGRSSHEGARSMLRYMTNYLTDNALHPVALADMRAAWAGLMAEPTVTRIASKNTSGLIARNLTPEFSGAKRPLQ